MTKSEFETLRELTRKLNEVRVGMHYLLYIDEDGSTPRGYHLVKLLAQYCDNTEDCLTCELDPWCSRLFKIAPSMWTIITDD